MASVLTSSASPSKFRRIRWRSAGSATARMSSTETNAWPRLSAWIFAARTIACAARGLAPYRTYRFTIERGIR